MLPETNPNAPAPTSSTKKNRATRYFLIGAAVVSIIALTWFLFKDALTLQYYNIRYNEARAGDKLYPAAWMVRNKEISDVSIFRTAVPVNSSGGRIAIKSGWKISGDKLLKLNDPFLGFYKGDEMVDIQLGDERFKVILAEISARREVLERSNYEDDLNLPKGYKYDDGPFYVMVDDTSVHPPK